LCLEKCGFGTKIQRSIRCSAVGGVGSEELVRNAKDSDFWRVKREPSEVEYVQNFEGDIGKSSLQKWVV
jgi:hypothetical protein